MKTINPPRLDTCRRALRFACPLLFLLLLPIPVFYCVEWFTHNPWTTMYPNVQRLNLVFYELVYLTLYFLFGRIRPAAIAGTVFFGGFGLLNYFVMQFRSAPIVPWDINSLGTAVSVADNYDYSLTLQAGVSLTVLLLLLLLSFCFRTKSFRMKLKYRIAGLLICLTMIPGYIWLLSQDSFVAENRLDNTLFTPHVMARKNGLCVSFLMDLRYMNVEAPDGYDKETVEALLDRTSEEVPPADTEDLPNIIVIMDEAFSDPAVLGDFTTNIDYMPFIHELQNREDVLTGVLNVSVKGGNTANTEFEFLTGSSMRFLPSGSVPYQQYLFDDTDSLASWLDELGYTTSSIHPFNATGWNRNLVYQYFGFENILFNSDFKNPERIRKYISDDACFDRITRILEEKPQGQPAFVFAVTMQNHSSYRETFDNFTPDVTVDDAPSNEQTRLLQNYLSLMKITDEALEDFLLELSASDEKTIVIFFGDHQPNDIVVDSVWQINQVDPEELTEEQSQARYQVPYLVWSNYELPADLSDNGILQKGDETSPNYLAAQVMKLTEIPLAPWQSAELEAAKKIPVLTTQKTVGDLTDPAVSEAFSLLEQIQYYQIFDHE